MEKRIELRVDQLSLTFKFEDENVAYDKHVQRCEAMIKDLIVEYSLEKIFISLEKLQGRNGYTFGYRFVVDNQEMMSFGYSDKLQNMGLFVEFKATGLEEFLARSEIDFVKFIQGLNKLTRAQGYQGKWKITRYDIAADLFNYGIDLTRIHNKIVKGTVKFQKLSKRGNTTIDKYIDRALDIENRVKYVGSGDKIETLYVGTRKWKSSFLRFYNKYLDVIDKGKKAEDKCFSSDWYRYEIELKFDVTSGTSFFEAVSRVKTEEDFKVFHAKQILDNFRLVTYRGNDVSFIGDIAKIASGGDFGHISANESRSFELEKSKQYFISGKSGLQSLIYKIKKTEGFDAVLDFLNDMLEYQEKEYKPNQSDVLYERRYNSDTF